MRHSSVLIKTEAEVQCVCACVWKRFLHVLCRPSVMLLGMLLVTLHEDVWVTVISCQNSQWALLYSNQCCVWDQWGESTVPVSILVNLCGAQPLLFFVIVRQFIFPKYVSVSDLVECISLLNDQHCLICRTIRNVY